MDLRDEQCEWLGVIRHGAGDWAGPTNFEKMLFRALLAKREHEWDGAPQARSVRKNGRSCERPSVL
jgi:hypothetical protein